MDAITTMDRAIMMVWLTPAMMLGSASGIWMSNSRRQVSVPKASAASSTSLSTSRIPRLVSRITGGTA